MTAKFGPAGNSDSFRAMGYRKTGQVPEYIRRMGLDAYEYQCGKGVTVGEATARAIGRAAEEAGIALSLHAPYFVNPANPDPDSQEKTVGYVLSACRAAQWMGADRVVIRTEGLKPLEGETTQTYMRDNIGGHYLVVKSGLLVRAALSGTSSWARQRGLAQAMGDMAELGELIYQTEYQRMDEGEDDED